MNKDSFLQYKNSTLQFDLIFSDPPYFLSNDGVTCKSGNMVSVNKGSWDRTRNKNLFNKKWIEFCYNNLRLNGSLFVSGTYHNIHDVAHLSTKKGFNLVQDIIWFKPNAPPNLACKQFTDSQETILWLCKGDSPTFNYEQMKNWDVRKDKINNQGKQMRSVWSIPITPSRERFLYCKKCDEIIKWNEKSGHVNHKEDLIKHPTQKPLELLNRIITCASNENDLIGDPFLGSGTTVVSAIRLKRNFHACEKNKTYFKIAKKRINIELRKPRFKSVGNLLK